MPDVHTQTPMTGNRIETVLKETRRLKHAKSQRTYKKKNNANKRMVDQVGKRMAEHIVGGPVSLVGICHIIVWSHRSHWRGLHPRGAGAAS